MCGGGEEVKKGGVLNNTASTQKAVHPRRYSASEAESRIFRGLEPRPYVSNLLMVRPPHLPPPPFSVLTPTDAVGMARRCEGQGQRQLHLHLPRGVVCLLLGRGAAAHQGHGKGRRRGMPGHCRGARPRTGAVRYGVVMVQNSAVQDSFRQCLIMFMQSCPCSDVFGLQPTSRASL